MDMETVGGVRFSAGRDGIAASVTIPQPYCHGSELEELEESLIFHMDELGIDTTQYNHTHTTMFYILDEIKFTVIKGIVKCAKNA